MSSDPRSNSRFRNRPTRRAFIGRCGAVAAGAACGSLLLDRSARASSAAFAASAPAAPPSGRATRVIFLFMAGGPSQLELFDEKPALARHDGSLAPSSAHFDEVEDDEVEDDADADERPRLMAPRVSFRRCGQSGQVISNALPHLQSVADELCVIRSMHTDSSDHASAQLLALTGCPSLGAPSLGARVSHAFGAGGEAPAFAVLASGWGMPGGAAMWDSASLPAEHRGRVFRKPGDPLANVISDDASTDPRGWTDVSDEDARTMERYGATPGGSSFANQCLIARRLVERGSRFVQLMHGGWDHHSEVASGVAEQCALTDRPIAALIADLRQRGLLEETLVVWAGEFGRSPVGETNYSVNRVRGRDHQPAAFSAWLAGGGVRAGTSHGRSDDLGIRIAEGAVHVNDLHAAVLHALGIHDAAPLAPARGGGRVVTELFA